MATTTVRGVIDGVLVDPRGYFESLTSGIAAADWRQVLNDIAPALEKFGIGQQRDSAGEPRGRLYLPHHTCRNAAPRPNEARFGVRQEAPCWQRAIDVVDGDGAAAHWVWIDHGGPTYVAIEPETTDGDTNSTDKFFEALATMLLEDTKRIASGLEAIADTGNKLIERLDALQRDGVKVRLR